MLGSVRNLDGPEFDENIRVVDSRGSEDRGKENRRNGLSYLCGFDENKRKLIVPRINPETEEEKKRYETAPARAVMRRQRREESNKFADFLTVSCPWE